ncbi:hypothetical protein F5Y14DRAFT_192905 [Nemania sp. NC0429]|nr:hypothetical protein F5Y14DRAFT_192905 [Nemania sp. NC0429]
MMGETQRSEGSVSTAPEARYAWRKRPRKFAPKSRQGCKTCKIRHIKCDLSKPHCEKCVSTGRQCDGYDQPSSLDHVAYSDSQSQTQAQRDSWEKRASGPIALDRNPNPPLILPLANPQEWSALQFFESRTLPQLNECRASTAWVRTLMFFSQTAVCVRHAAIAVGAMHRAYIDDPKSVRNTRLSNDKQDRGTFALYHYNVAIRSLLHSRAKSNSSITNASITLLVCYLFTCFDSLSGSDMQAFKHLRSGVQVLSETQKALQEITSEPVTSSSYELIQQITEQFRRLDREAVTFLMDWLPQLPPPSMTNNQHYGIPYLGGPLYLAFHSLGQAADHLQNLVTRTLTLNRWDEVYPRPNVDPKAYLGPLPTARATERRNQLLGQLEEWSLAFAALNPNQENVNPTEKRLISMLLLHYNMCHLFLSAYTVDGEMSYDAFMPQFQTTISLAAALANLPPTVPDYYETHDHSTGSDSSTDAREPSFTLEIGMIPTLYLAGLKCRDPFLRRQVLRILRHTHRRETVWDSFATAHVVQRVMEIEEGRRTGEGNAEMKAAVVKAVDIPLERRVVATHWSPVCTGPRCIVIFELCSPDPESRVISESLDL